MPDDHLARLLWQAVEQLDLAAFAAGLTMREGGPGRPAADLAGLVALCRTPPPRSSPVLAPSTSCAWSMSL